MMGLSLRLGKIQRLLENHKIMFSYNETFLNEVANRCTEVENGARNVDNILTNFLLSDISRRILGSMDAREKISAIEVGIGEDGPLYMPCNRWLSECDRVEGRT